MEVFDEAKLDETDDTLENSFQKFIICLKQQNGI
jgi:hypothetical protein